MVDISSIFNSLPSLAILFFILIYDSAILIPGSSVLIATYGAFANNIYDLFLLVIIVIIASAIGDISTYLLARYLSDRLLRYLRKYNWFIKNERMTRIYLKKYEFSFVFFSRFLISETSQIVNYVAGFEKLDLKRFVLAVVLGDAFYGLLYAGIGFIFRSALANAINSLQTLLLEVFLTALAVYLLYRLIRMLKK